jgi:hypothetical protein
MLYIFRAVVYYTNLLIKPTTAQFYLYNLRHVSAVIIRPSSGRILKLLFYVIPTIVLTYKLLTHGNDCYI